MKIKILWLTLGFIGVGLGAVGAVLPMLPAFPFLLLVSIVSFQAGILNSFERFAAPASAPIILNLYNRRD